MQAPHATKQRKPRSAGADAREQLLAPLPVTERHLEVGGVNTSLLEGGSGPSMVLLHGPGEFAAKWLRVIPDLVTTHHVIAPDLPGHGASEVAGGALDADAVLDWLGELIEQTCPSPPVLVGQIIGGAIAARFASERGDRLSRLILADALGLAPFQPAPAFGRALQEFSERPTDDTYDGLWQRCAFDLDALRDRMEESWTQLKAYALDRAGSPGARTVLPALMEQFAFPAIPDADLQKIAVPTALIWGRHDLATPLSVAEAASARYGWPLHVIEDAADDPPIEQPEAFLEALRASIDSA
jgi:pimeloyl-ACP methyl ester carboxylesterase